MPPTRDATNAPAALRAVFSEIMYYPRPDLYSNPDDFEFVELYNPSTAPIPLCDTNGVWRLDGAVQFEFSDKPVLAPGTALLIVPFNPTNQTALTAFQQAYHLTNASVP